MGRLFCAGGDVSLFNDAGKQICSVLSHLAGTLHSAISHLVRMQKPLLTLINGPAWLPPPPATRRQDIVIAGGAESMTRVPDRSFESSPPNPLSICRDFA
jgi:2-(1,2-epoxy-1,2-dihydrophenyl)acetyl-CoA isomerase